MRPPLGEWGSWEAAGKGTMRLCNCRTAGEKGRVFQSKDRGSCDTHGERGGLRAAA